MRRLSELADLIDERTEELKTATAALGGIEDMKEEAEAIRDGILAKMEALRAACDEAETITAKEYWPYPSYGELLFSVR